MALDYKAMRYHVSDFVADLKDPNTLYHCGTGFTKLDENPNTVTESTAYIDAISSSEYTTGYAVKFSYSVDMHMSSAPTSSEMLYEVGRNAKTGTNAMMYYIRTDPRIDTSTGDSYLIDIPCRRFKVSVVPGAITGDALSSITFSGEMTSVGDFEEGYVTINPDDMSAVFSTTKTGGSYSYSSAED